MFQDVEAGLLEEGRDLAEVLAAPDAAQAGRLAEDGPAVLARFWIAKALFFTPPLRKHALLYQVGLEDGLFLLQGHSEFAC